MKPGDRVKERKRVGTLLEIYELTDQRGNRLGRKSAEVIFDGDKTPTRGVWVKDLQVMPSERPS